MKNRIGKGKNIYDQAIKSQNSTLSYNTRCGFSPKTISENTNVVIFVSIHGIHLSNGKNPNFGIFKPPYWVPPPGQMLVYDLTAVIDTPCCGRLAYHISAPKPLLKYWKLTYPTGCWDDGGCHIHVLIMELPSFIFLTRVVPSLQMPSFPATFSSQQAGRALYMTNIPRECPL